MLGEIVGCYLCILQCRVAHSGGCFVDRGTLGRAGDICSLSAFHCGTQRGAQRASQAVSIQALNKPRPPYLRHRDAFQRSFKMAKNSVKLEAF